MISNVNPEGLYCPLVLLGVMAVQLGTDGTDMRMCTAEYQKWEINDHVRALGVNQCVNVCICMVPSDGLASHSESARSSRVPPGFLE